MSDIHLPPLVTEEERRRLKGVADQAIKLTGGSQIEPRSRVKKAALSKYGSASEPDAFIPIDVILEVDRHNAAPLITSTLAAMQGYRLVLAEEAEDAQLALADAQAVAKETGDVVNVLLSLLTSGRRMSAADRQEVLREIAEAKASLYRLASKIGAAS